MKKQRQYGVNPRASSLDRIQADYYMKASQRKINKGTTLISDILHNCRDLTIRQGSFIHRYENVDFEVKILKDKNTNRWRPWVDVNVSIREGERYGMTQLRL